jgi:homoaconitate hydratase
MQRVSELEKKNIAIQKAYILSCTNGRVSDFVSAANVLRGKKVAPGMRFVVVACFGVLAFGHFGNDYGIKRISA